MNKDLHALADEYWEHVLRTNPTNAHMLGDYRYIDRFEDVSREAEDAEIAARRAFADRARSFRTSDLSSADRTTQETLIYEAASSAAVSEMRQGEFGIDPIFGPQVVADVLIPQMTVETAEHADGMLEKFNSFAQMLDQSTQRLREGIANGRVNAEFAVTKAVASSSE